MELMSSFLLCVLVASLPQTFGGITAKFKSPKTAINYNNTLRFQQKYMGRMPVLLNVNRPNLVNNVSEIHSVYNDISCMNCHKCMDRAIKTYRRHIHRKESQPSAEDLRLDVLTNEISHRYKRDLQTTIGIITENITKKPKPKKHRNQKSVTVTKYNLDGEVYALKVKETPNLENISEIKESTCQLYNVKKSFPCGSPEGDVLLASARRKANKKKTKRDQTSTVHLTTTTTKTQTSVFKKREVDNSQVPENFMPSIEDIY